MAHIVKRRLPVFSTFIKTLLDDADATAALATLGVASGVYTPTLFNTTNLGASTAFETRYLRIGNTVLVAGFFAADATAAASTVTVLGVSIPIASNFAGSDDCGGVAALHASGGAYVSANTTNDRAEINWLSGTTANVAGGFAFSYEII